MHAALHTVCVCSSYSCSWVATYIDTCTNETHSLALLQELIPTLATVFIKHYIMHVPKVGINSCRSARECVSFVHVSMYVATQLQL